MIDVLLPKHLLLCGGMSRELLDLERGLGAKFIKETLALAALSRAIILELFV